MFKSLRRTPEDAALQARIDTVVAAARAASPVVELRKPVRELSPPPLAASEAILDLRLQEELAYARRLIEALGDALSDDAIVLARHHTILQNVDILAQTLGHIAQVVGAADKVEAIERIGMATLKARLSRPAAGSDVEPAPTLQRAPSNPFA